MTELLPGVTPEMLHPEYWISRCEDYQTYSRVDANARLSSAGKGYPLSKDGVYPFVMPSKAAQELFDEQGQVIDQGRWDNILRASTLRTESVAPGFAVTPADIRRFATSTQTFRKRDDREFDQFQETTVHTFEPVIVVGESEDGNWLYIYTTTYRGFIHKEAIGRTTWDVFDQVCSGATFAVVTAEHTRTQPQPYNHAVSHRVIEFGAILPLVDANNIPSLGRQIGLGHTCVMLPVRNSSGELEMHEAYVHNRDVHLGFLPFNRKTCVELAFVLLHQRYGWGGRLGVHDCSSFVMDVYRMMGVNLPRDAGDQEAAIEDKVVFSKEDSSVDRCHVLSDFHTGDLLYMDGHTMVYLGMKDGRPYAIHDFAGYVHEGQEVPVNQVMVSTLDVFTSSGAMYLEALTSVGRVMVN